jgi:ABC-type glycerol-3-phosphate transport system substrate-binding protein
VALSLPLAACGGSDSLHAVSVDTVPFVMYVNEDIFDKYGLKVPTTWDEFEQTGRQLKEKGYDGKLTNWQSDGTAVNIALFSQKNAKVYKYSANDPTKVGVDFNQKGIKDVLSYWQRLAKDGLIDTECKVGLVVWMNRGQISWLFIHKRCVWIPFTYRFINDGEQRVRK